MSGGERRGWLGWLLGTPEPPPPTRLTADEAVALAAASPGVRALNRPLTMASPRMKDERVHWRVSNPGIGSQWWVEVDDATGAVSEVHHASRR